MSSSEPATEPALESGATPRITLVVAKARNGAIGKDNQLLWHIPEDLAHFKRVTMGAPIVMGRKTWESIGRPLPGRRNMVITRQPDYVAAGAEVAGSLAQALIQCQALTDVYVIGGGEIYAQALPLASRLIVTEVDRDFDGDAFFPPIDPAQWQASSRETHHAPAPLDLDYAFVTYLRSGA